MKIEIGRRDGRGWVHGTTDEGHSFDAKVYDGPSVHGVPTERFPEGGSVSKMCVRDSEGREVRAWDRGPCYGETVPHYAEAAAAIAWALEEKFCEGGERE